MIASNIEETCLTIWKALMDTTWLMAAAAATEPNPIMDGMGGGEPVDIRNNLSCISVERDKIAAKARVQAAIGITLFASVYGDSKVFIEGVEGEIAMRL